MPALARDRANHILLARDREALQARKAYLENRIKLCAANRYLELWPDGGGGSSPQDTGAELKRCREELEEVDAKLTGVNQITDRLDNPVNGHPAYLLGYDPNKGASGRVIVAVGDPDTADNVATFVPGTGANIRHPGGDINRADVMVLDSEGLDAHKRTSVIMWLGYDAPQSLLTESPQDHFAEDARADLRRFQDGLRATHDGPSSHNTVLSHSYGTTVVGFTAREEAGIDADDVVFIASPGTGADNADAMHLRGNHQYAHSGDHVWATTAPQDPIHATPNSWFGGNPTDDGDFGGHEFTSDNSKKSGILANHSGYWEDGNHARKAFANVITGHPENVK